MCSLGFRCVQGGALVPHLHDSQLEWRCPGVTAHRRADPRACIASESTSADRAQIPCEAYYGADREFVTRLFRARPTGPANKAAESDLIEARARPS